MDVRFVYSLILIISMMFLCLMIPPDSKQKSKEKENITRMDLKSQLIINLLYPKKSTQRRSIFFTLNQSMKHKFPLN